MGNSFATKKNSLPTATAPLGKTHDPGFQWKIYDFSALLERGPKTTISDTFYCSGFLQVTPMHRKPGVGTPYVALSLVMSRRCLEPGDKINVMFELSIYNHSNGTYNGCKASYMFHTSKNCYSEMECLIPLKEVLKSSDFLDDDTCVLGVEILKVDVVSPEIKSIVVDKKATIVEHLFIQKKGFIERTYTWTVNNFLELDMKDDVHSPTFQVGGYKWHLSMYPRGEKHSTDCLSLFLVRHASDEFLRESREVVELTLSILDQKLGKYFSKTGIVVFGDNGVYGWPNFLALKTLKDQSSGYLVGSTCIVKADLIIVGSSAHPMMARSY